MIRSFIQMTALISTLESTVFLLRSNLGLMPETIVKLSATYWSYSKPIAEELAKQAANTRVGVILLLFAFILQLINSLWPMRVQDLLVDWHGVIISIVFSLVLLAFAAWYSKNLASRMIKDSMKIIQNDIDDFNRQRG